MMHKQNRQQGFTLIEAVVSAAVFAFVISSSMAVYMATVRLDTKSRAERAVQQNARFIMDYVGKEVRNGSIDYTKANDNDTLNLISQQDDEIQIEKVNDRIILTKNGASTSLNSSDVLVTALSFNLIPDEDPFNLANDVHIQPHVTMVLSLISAEARTNESSSMNIQSTFTVRDYPSRQ